MLALSNRFLETIDSRGADGTRPTTNDGTSITPGASSTYGSYAAVGSALTSDAYWIEVYVHTVTVTASNRMIMLNVGADPAGGSSFSPIISGLLCGAPTALQTGRITVFKFPLRIPSGATLAIKAASLDATTTAIRAWVKTKHRPTRPEVLRVGTFVQTFGVTEPTVGGVVVTPGTVSEGAWAEIGTADKSLFFLEFGYSIDDTTMTTANIDVDIGVGDASNKQIAIANAHVITNANEDLSKRAYGEYCDVAVGDKLYARSQSSAAVDSSNSVAVYGVGG